MKTLNRGTKTQEQDLRGASSDDPRPNASLPGTRLKGALTPREEDLPVREVDSTESWNSSRIDLKAQKLA